MTLEVANTSTSMETETRMPFAIRRRQIKRSPQHAAYDDTPCHTYPSTSDGSTVGEEDVRTTNHRPVVRLYCAACQYAIHVGSLSSCNVGAVGQALHHHLSATHRRVSECGHLESQLSDRLASFSTGGLVSTPIVVHIMDDLSALAVRRDRGASSVGSRSGGGEQRSVLDAFASRPMHLATTSAEDNAVSTMPSSLRSFFEFASSSGVHPPTTIATNAAATTTSTFDNDFFEQLAAAASFFNSAAAPLRGCDAGRVPPFHPLAAAGSGVPPPMSVVRNSTKTLKCPRCNWHYKYQETLEIHMKEKHAEGEVNCAFCADGQPHPKLARGENYSCGYKPYRCDLCKYSTTTKGNLSIHMQSDKHLHALQDSPGGGFGGFPMLTGTSSLLFGASPLLLSGIYNEQNSNMANNNNNSNISTNNGNISFAMEQIQTATTTIPTSTNDNSTFVRAAMDATSRTCGSVDEAAMVEQQQQSDCSSSTATESATLQCLICLAFVNDDVTAMLEHAEADRSGGALPGDIQAGHGCFQCNLCPYSTSLKANFQLHTKTDKHLQRVQLINHIRECGGAEAAIMAENSKFAPLLQRLSAIKSVVQVRCQPCQETFSCAISLREHCESQSHVIRAEQHNNQQQHQRGRLDLLFDQQKCPDNGQQKQQHSLSIFSEMFLAAAASAINRNCDAIVPEYRLEQQQQQQKQIFKNTQQQKQQTTKTFVLTTNSNSNNDNIADIDCDCIDCCNEAANIIDAFNITVFGCLLCEHQELTVDTVRDHFKSHHENIGSGTSCVNIAMNINKRRSSDPQKASPQDYHATCSDAADEEYCKLENDGSSLLTTIVEEKQQKKKQKQQQQHQHQHQPGDQDQEAFLYFRYGEKESRKLFKLAPIFTWCQLKRVMEEQRSSTAQHSAPVDDATDGDGLGLEAELISSIAVAQRCPVADASSCRDSSFADATSLQHHLIDAHCAEVLHPSAAVCQRKRRRSTPDEDADSTSSDKQLDSFFGIENFVGDGSGIASSSASLSSATLQAAASTSRNADAEQIGKSTGSRSTHCNNSTEERIPIITKFMDSTTTISHHCPTITSNNNINNAKQQHQQQQQHVDESDDVPLENGIVADDAGGASGNSVMMMAMFQQMMQQFLMQQQQHQHQQQHSFDSNDDSTTAATMQQHQQQLLFDAFAQQFTNVHSAPSTNNNNKFDSTITTTSIKGAKRQRQNVDDDEEAAEEKPFCASAPPPTAAGKQRRGTIAVATTATAERPTRADSTPSAASSTALLGAIAQQQAVDESAGLGDHLTAMMMAAMSNAAAATTLMNNADSNATAPPADSPTKRARTRITDEQLKVLRQYFDINNSPSEEQVKEMSRKSQLSEKVIKHWFRNTLFKERQRDKDSPYNFSVPPQMSIDLATYEKTGEAKITSIKSETKSVTEKADQVKEDEPSAESLSSRNASPNPSVSSSTENPPSSSTADDFRAVKNEGVAADESNVADSAADIADGRAGTAEPFQEQQRRQQLEQQHQQQLPYANTGNGMLFNNELFFANLNKMAAAAANNYAGLFGVNGGGGGGNNNTVDFAALFGSGGGGEALSSASMFGGAFSNGNQQRNNQSPSASPPSGQLAVSSFKSAVSSSALTDMRNVSTNAASSGNPFTNGGGSISSAAAAAAAASSLVGGGRRANRTRFTDYQLRTLQHFFEVQAYPKDDDLEMLSKKLQLSPRVIVVWFQNARQKARKIYENGGAGPNLLLNASAVSGNGMIAEDSVSTGRVASGGGGSCIAAATMQCQRCSAHFQRYADLVSHQLRACYAADVDALTQDNRYIEEQLTDEERLGGLMAFGGAMPFVNPLAVGGHLGAKSAGSFLNGLLAAAAAAAALANSAGENTSAAIIDAAAGQIFGGGGSGGGDGGGASALLTAEALERFNNNNNKCSAETSSGHQFAQFVATALGGAVDAGGEPAVTTPETTSGSSSDAAAHSAQDLMRMIANNTSMSTALCREQVDDAEDDCGSGPPAKMAKRRRASFSKRCPLCCLLFHVRDKLVDHVGEKHAEQAAAIDVDLLPDAEDVPTFSALADDLLGKLCAGSLKENNNGAEMSNFGSPSPLDLSLNSTNNDIGDDQRSTFSPAYSRRSDDNNSEEGGGGNNNRNARVVSRAVSASPSASATAAAASLATAFASIGANNGLFAQYRRDTTAQQQQSRAGKMSSFNAHNSAVACAAAAAAAANNSKRYRTHLTPLQVYIMKLLFNDYKTPSMNECEILGREIGLHKRVVQVWFQNARAKERKCRNGSMGPMSSGGDAEADAASTSLSISGEPRAADAQPPTYCELCEERFGVGSGGRASSIQDHIFTRAHIERVKERGAQLRGMSAGDGTTAESESVCSSATRGGSGSGCLPPPRSPFGGSASGGTSSVRRPSSNASSSSVGAAPNSNPMANAAAFQNNFLYSLMLQNGSLPSLVEQQMLVGTPIPMLQISETVMQMIGSDLAHGCTTSRFTQDGLHFAQLADKVSQLDFKCAQSVESEVGWTCTQCSNVFQQESHLRNHQKLICQGCDGVLRLIQIHYECMACSARFGTQNEFVGHCESSAHKNATKIHNYFGDNSIDMKTEGAFAMQNGKNI